jgi:hypothetical protein
LQAATPWSKDLHALGKASGLPPAFRAAAQTVVRGAHTCPGRPSASGLTGSLLLPSGVVSPHHSTSRDSASPRCQPASASAAQIAQLDAEAPSTTASSSKAAEHEHEQDQGPASTEDLAIGPCLLSTLPGELLESILATAAWPPWVWSPLLSQAKEERQQEEQLRQQRKQPRQALEHVLNVSAGSPIWELSPSLEWPGPRDGRVQVVPFPTLVPTPEIHLPRPFASLAE